MPEKLYTIQEAAKFLNISEEEVKRLVDVGEVPAYKVGGIFLRFRKEQIEAIKREVDLFEAEAVGSPRPAPGPGEKPSHLYTDLEREIKKREPMVSQYDYTFAERLSDFWYFNDFYLISVLFVIFIMIVILS